MATACILVVDEQGRESVIPLAAIRSVDQLDNGAARIWVGTNLRCITKDRYADVIQAMVYAGTFIYNAAGQYKPSVERIG